MGKSEQDEVENKAEGTKKKSTEVGDNGDHTPGVPEDSGMRMMTFRNSKQDANNVRRQTVLENRPGTWENKDHGSLAPWLTLWPPPKKIC